MKFQNNKLNNQYKIKLIMYNLKLLLFPRIINIRIHIRILLKLKIIKLNQ